jgi:hypothetical protein
MTPLYWHVVSLTRANDFTGISNSKLRVTGHIMVNAEGAFAPLFLIIKHNVKKQNANETSARVIENLHKEPEYAGWELKKYRRIFVDEKTGKVDDFRVKYIEHPTEGHIITSQNKAWNDKFRYSMYLDLVVSKLKDSPDDDIFIWQDNCSLHHTTEVEEVALEKKITFGFLPPNTTHLLQVLDLVVNGPIKYHIRRINAERIYSKFALYREHYARLTVDKRKKSKFIYPKPVLKDVIYELIDVFNNDFKSAKFQKTVQSCFIKVGPGDVLIRCDCADCKGELLFPRDACGKRYDRLCAKFCNRFHGFYCEAHMPL